MTREPLEKLIAVVETRSSGMASFLHGPQHWRCVSLVGVRLARLTPNADALVAFLFGLFHDAMRENEDEDPGHGRRGALLFTALYEEELIPVSPAQAEMVRYACETHTEAAPTNRAPVGVCYDADRLNLWRLGIRPERKYLSTKAGIRMAGEGAIQTLHYDPLSWGDVLNELF